MCSYFLAPNIQHWHWPLQKAWWPRSKKQRALPLKWVWMKEGARGAGCQQNLLSDPSTPNCRNQLEKNGINCSAFIFNLVIASSVPEIILFKYNQEWPIILSGFLIFMRIKLQPDLGNLLFSGMDPNPKLELLKFSISLKIIINTH